MGSASGAGDPRRSDVEAPARAAATLSPSRVAVRPGCPPWEGSSCSTGPTPRDARGGPGPGGARRARWARPATDTRRRARGPSPRRVDVGRRPRRSAIPPGRAPSPRHTRGVPHAHSWCAAAESDGGAPGDAWPAPHLGQLESHIARALPGRRRAGRPRDLLRAPLHAPAAHGGGGHRRHSDVLSVVLPHRVSNSCRSMY
jgi:hypothetical protein